MTIKNSSLVLLQRNDLAEVLTELLFLLNLDKDNSYFLCEEAEPLLEKARELLDSIENEDLDHEPQRNFTDNKFL